MDDTGRSRLRYELMSRTRHKRSLIAAMGAWSVIYASVAAPLLAHAKDTEIKVSLFGQPCTLIGPKDAATLKAIHAVSPEQIPPVRSEAQALVALERIKKSSRLPGELNIYIDKIEKYVLSQQAFYQGLAAARRDKNSDRFLEQVEKHLREGAIHKVAGKPQLPSDLKAALEKSIKESSEAALQELIDIHATYSDELPEEFFHRAIKKIGIRYVCTFEEGSIADEAPEAAGAADATE